MTRDEAIAATVGAGQPFELVDAVVAGRQEIGHHQSLGDELNSAMVWRN